MEKEIDLKGQNRQQVKREISSELFVYSLSNECIETKVNRKDPTDSKHQHSYASGSNNYHFLTRSTESITRLTSSLARLRVSKRIIPLRFIMAMVAIYKFPDDPNWVPVYAGRDCPIHDLGPRPADEENLSQR